MSESTVVVIPPSNDEPVETPPAPAVVEVPVSTCCEHCVSHEGRIATLEAAAVVTATAVAEVAEVAEEAEQTAEAAESVAELALTEVETEPAPVVIEEPKKEEPEIEPRSKTHPFWRSHEKLEG